MSVKVPITGIVTELNFVIRTCSILCYPKTKIVFRLTITKFIIQNVKSHWPSVKIFLKKKSHFRSKLLFYIQFWLKNSILNWTFTVLMIFGNGQFPVVKFWLNNCHFVKKWCNINDSPFAILGWIDIFDRFCRQFYILSWQRFWRDFSMLLAGVFSLKWILWKISEIFKPKILTEFEWVHFWSQVCGFNDSRNYKNWNLIHYDGQKFTKITKFYDFRGIHALCGRSSTFKRLKPNNLLTFGRIKGSQSAK